jgi:PAS domain S-box-containing protein
MEESYNIINQSPAIVFIWKNEIGWPVEYVSENVESVFGYTPEEFLSGTVSYADVIHPDDMKRILHDLAAYARNKREKRIDQEYRIITRDGNLVWLDHRTLILRDEQGEIKRYQGIVLDITRRKRLEEKLREKERKISAILQAAPTGIGVVVNRMFTEVNQRFCEMVGYVEPELLGQDARMLYFSDEEYEAIGSKQRKFFREGGVMTIESRLRHKSGKKVNIFASWKLLEKDKDSAAIIFNALDITELKETEKKRLQSEYRFRSMMESMSDMVYICSADFRVEYMNPAMIKRTGWDAIGEFCYQAIHDLSSRCPWCIITSEKHGTYFESSVDSPKDDRSYHVSHSPIINDDGSISTMVVLRDTTNFKRMEEQLSQAQKMELIGNLAGGVAHDFNNILTVISGYAQILQLGLPEGSKLYSDVEQIIKAGDRAAALTRQLLTFSRKQMIMPQTVDINQLIADMKKMLERLLPEDIRLTTLLDEEIDSVFADPSQLEQVVLNLVVNARDAVNERSLSTEKMIRISTSKIFLDRDYVVTHKETGPGWYLQLQVDDNGCGMSPAVIERIFEPFYTTKGVGRGTGMGLATVYGIVKQNQGSIYVYSEPGRGSTFKIYWPLKNEDSGERKEEEDKFPIGGNEVIMLVEDDEALRGITGRQLRQVGYTVIEAVNGKAALKEAAGRQPGTIDMLFTDVVMPVMGGGELAASIWDIHPGIVILLSSGYPDDRIRQDIVDLGKDRFIEKPYNIKDLLRRIRSLLDARQG